MLCSQWWWRRFQCFVWENCSSWNINHDVELVSVLAAYFWWRALCWYIILIILAMTSMMILLNNSITIRFAKELLYIDIVCFRFGTIVVIFMNNLKWFKRDDVCYWFEEEARNNHLICAWMIRSIEKHLISAWMI